MNNVVYKGIHHHRVCLRYGDVNSPEILKSHKIEVLDIGATSELLLNLVFYKVSEEDCRTIEFTVVNKQEILAHFHTWDKLDSYLDGYFNNMYVHETNCKMIGDLTESVASLSKKLLLYKALSSISNYVTGYVLNPEQNIGQVEFLQTVQSMLIGLIGVNNCSVYIKDKVGSMVCKTTTCDDISHHKFIGGGLNSTDPYAGLYINSDIEFSTCDTHSVLGYPLWGILGEGEVSGFVVLESDLQGFFQPVHSNFIEALANQIRLALNSRDSLGSLKEIASTDALTSLYTKRMFYNKLQEIHDTCVSTENFVMCMFDIDKFKMCNDTYGHMFGDTVLKGVAEVIKSTLRGKDIVCRYGGEEFTAYMWGLPQDRVEEIALRRMNDIRLKIQALVFREHPEYKVTISIGLAIGDIDCNWIGDCRDQYNTILEKADKALYTAKETGRNKVIVFKE